MKPILSLLILFFIQPSFADSCENFVGDWKGICHSEKRDFELNFKVTKIGNCEGLSIFGEDLYFNKVKASTENKSDRTTTKHSLLTWSSKEDQTVIEVFKGTFDTRFASGNTPASTDSWKNDFFIYSTSNFGPYVTLFDQSGFLSGDMYRCQMRIQK